MSIYVGAPKQIYHIPFRAKPPKFTDYRGFLQALKIIKAGGFENCFCEPCSLEGFLEDSATSITPFLYEPKFVSLKLRTQVTFSGNCGFRYCWPEPYPIIQARRDALFLRKYGDRAFYVKRNKRPPYKYRYPKRKRDYYGYNMRVRNYFDNDRPQTGG